MTTFHGPVRATRLRWLRVGRNLTQAALASKIGVAQMTISNAEIKATASFEVLQLLAREFAVPVDRILEVVDEHHIECPEGPAEVVPGARSLRAYFRVKQLNEEEQGR